MSPPRFVRHSTFPRKPEGNVADSIRKNYLRHNDNVLCVSEFSMCLESIYLEVFNALFFFKREEWRIMGIEVMKVFQDFDM